MQQQLLHSIKSAIKIKDQSNLHFPTIKMCYLPSYDYILSSFWYYKQKEATKEKLLCWLEVSVGEYRPLHLEVKAALDGRIYREQNFVAHIQ